MELAPAIVGVPRKSTEGPLDEARVLRRALTAAHAVHYAVPILHAGRIIGFSMGDGHGNAVWRPATVEERSPRYRLGWDDLQQMENKVRAGQMLRQGFAKVPSGFFQKVSWWDLWPVTGLPDVGGYTGTAFTRRDLTDADAGAIWHGGNQSPATKHLLEIKCNGGFVSTVLVLYDRVATYDNCTFNAGVTQNLTNTGSILRYSTAASGGCAIMIPKQDTLGLTAATLSAMNYTNQAGAGQTVPDTPSFDATGASGPSSTQPAEICCPYNSATFGAAVGFAVRRATGDYGAISVQSYKTSAANSGHFTIVLMRPLAFLVVPPLGSVGAMYKSFVHHAAVMERIFDGACLACVTQTATSVSPGVMMTGWN
jgi:hypothetical protein